MKVFISKSSGIEDYIYVVIGRNPAFIKSFCKKVGLKEIELILILLGEKVEVDIDVVTKINEDMKENLFTPPKDNKIRFD